MDQHLKFQHSLWDVKIFKVNLSFYLNYDISIGGILFDKQKLLERGLLYTAEITKYTLLMHKFLYFAARLQNRSCCKKVIEVD